MTPAALLDELDTCVEDGSLRRLGCAFARFIASLAETPPCVVLTCVLLSELESRGDTCLLLDDLVPDPCAKLHLDRESCERLRLAAGGFPESTEAWGEILSGCPQVLVPGKRDCNQPLVLEHDRLYLRRFWSDERSIARMVAQRCASFRSIDAGRVKSLLDKLFPESEKQQPDWQKIACAVAARSNLSIITGGPGTGKTYTVARLLVLLHALAPIPARLRVALAAPSGKAAIRLKQSIDNALSDLVDAADPELGVEELMGGMPAARTLHSLLGVNPETRTVRYHANNPLDVDVLVVDEASMVHLEMMADLLEALPSHATLVLLGDKDQLASVEAGAVLGDLCEGAQHGHYNRETAEYVRQACVEELPASMVTGGAHLAQRTIMLRKSRRFTGPIGRLAAAINARDPEAASRCLREDPAGDVAWIEQAQYEDLLDLAVHGRRGAEVGYMEYLALAKARPRPEGGEDFVDWVRSVLSAFDRFRILCAVRQGAWGVEGVNQAIEQRLLRERLISRSGEWYVGRPVMVTRNDHTAGIYNGDIGITLPDKSRDGRLRVYFQSGDRITGVLPTRLPSIETAYAVTVHKVQGSEFGHVVLALPGEPNEIVVRELIYTGVTRARQRFTLVTPNAQLFADGIRKQTLRASGLKPMLGSDLNYDRGPRTITS